MHAMSRYAQTVRLQGVTQHLATWCVKFNQCWVHHDQIIYTVSRNETHDLTVLAVLQLQERYPWSGRSVQVKRRDFRRGQCDSLVHMSAPARVHVVCTALHSTPEYSAHSLAAA